MATDDRNRAGRPHEHDRQDAELDTTRDDELDTTDATPNPPRTTTGKVTAPKFGSAGSGGAELEPGPERN